MNRFRYLLPVLRQFGPGWAGARVAYAVRKRLGWYRVKLPVRLWAQIPMPGLLTDAELAFAVDYGRYRKERAPEFFLSSEWRAAYGKAFGEGATDAVDEAEGLIAGRVRLFSELEAEIGFPPEWHSNPLSGEATEGMRHWSRVPDSGLGDMRFFWEASRFGFTGALVRAYWATGNDRYAEAFWRVCEDWQEKNPPNMGPHWKCGRECSVRMIHWVLGMHALADSPATTPERTYNLAKAIAVTAIRIEADFEPARGLNDSRSLAQAVGLFTAGTLFPEFRGALRWRRTGRSALEDMARRLIYADGSFCEYSMNAQRVALDLFLWSARVAEGTGKPLGPEFMRRVRQAGIFLLECVEKETGSAPRYGVNDGARLLPLDGCDYEDFRPAAQAVRFLTDGRLCFGPGPWDEKAFWFFGPKMLDAPRELPERVDYRADSAGCFALRSERTTFFVRCGSHRHRPAHADQLHGDLRWRGQTIAIGPGSYLLDGAPPFQHAFRKTAFHNTVTVAGADQMDKVSRSLWLPWSRGQVYAFKRSANRQLAWWEGEHTGYQRLADAARHFRAVVSLGGDHILVLDRITSPVAQPVRLHWLIDDYPADWDGPRRRLALHTPRGNYWVTMGGSVPGVTCSLVRADEHSARGWQSPHYGELRPAISIDASTVASSLFFWTFFGSPAERATFEPEGLAVKTGKWEARIEFEPPGSRALIKQVLLAGDFPGGALGGD